MSDRTYSSTRVFREFLVRHDLEGDADSFDRIVAALTRSGEWDALEHLYRQARYRYFAWRRPMIVGEAPGPKGDPDCPLYPIPATGSGGRLMRAFGVSRGTYFQAFDRTNLIPRYPGARWNASVRGEARHAAEALVPLLQGRVVILCGREVRRAFGLDDAPLFSPTTIREERWARAARRITIVCIPHPSGRNRIWNDPTNQTQLRAVIKKLLPWLPEDGDQV